MILVHRGGRYYRVADPLWIDPLDPRYSKLYGGRWTPRGEFAGLYLCATADVAAANARRQHVGRAIGLFDLRPDARPHLVDVEVSDLVVADAVSDEGVADLRLRPSYPAACEHAVCQAIAREVHALGADGIAGRSAAEATRTSWIGEELTVFESAVSKVMSVAIRRFDEWYPDATPGAGDISPLIA